ncbi:MAG: hypothetical protein KGP35_07480 [Bacteroidetes bacterium]|nr:hypothetical protein [Bacteroidota bacterium]
MRFNFSYSRHMSLSMILIVLVACKKSNTPAISNEVGTISGTVYLYDDKTNRYEDASGVTVNIIGMPEKQSITAADGRFRLENIPFDHYDLAFSKTGYGTYKIFGIEHFKKMNSPAPFNTTLNRIISLGSISGTAIESLEKTAVADNNFIGIAYLFSVKPVPSASDRAYVRAFVGEKKNFTPIESIGYSSLKGVLNNNVTGTFSAEELYGMGLDKGDSVYVRLYGDSYYGNEYVDPVTGNTIFPNLNPVAPAAVGFIVP